MNFDAAYFIKTVFPTFPVVPNAILAVPDEYKYFFTTVGLIRITNIPPQAIITLLMAKKTFWIRKGDKEAQALPIPNLTVTSCQLLLLNLPIPETMILVRANKKNNPPSAADNQ